jgi:hypothetical protein
MNKRRNPDHHEEKKIRRKGNILWRFRIWKLSFTSCYRIDIVEEEETKAEKIFFYYTTKLTTILTVAFDNDEDEILNE